MRKLKRHCSIHRGRSCLCDETSREATLIAWHQWLHSREWSHFITVTYRNPRRSRGTGGDLSRVLRTVRKREPRARVFLAEEAHALGDLHVHGIVGPSSGSAKLSALTRRWLWRDLFTAYGRSEVSAVRSSEDVASYCVKYVTKAMSDYLVD